MSVPNKSLDKNKRYAGVKANDFVNKTRTNETNRSAVRPQGWANLGKINSRRVPPPANLPSLKSETGVHVPSFEPTVPINHGWSSNETPAVTNTPSNPTQQQIDSLPINSPTSPPTPPSSADVDKSRSVPTWSTVTAGSTVNPNEPIPNLLALNDFPRLATNSQDRRTPVDTVAMQPNPSFRPANLAIWKEGGGSRVQPSPNDIPQLLSNNMGPNMYHPPQQQQQQLMQNPNLPMYPPQMWGGYHSYGPPPPVMSQQRVNTMNDYKSPTILRNKDIDDLSKITDNTWATSTHAVNYEEKIRFSDDEDDDGGSSGSPTKKPFDSHSKPRRHPTQILTHPRLIPDDEHLKQMQEVKNSELINALTMAKQRREEQERHLRKKSYDEQPSSNADESKQIPGYQTRPLLIAPEQETLGSPSWHSNRDVPNASRTRHDTANSQSFSMKSWSEQMDSFNYSSLHDKPAGFVDNDHRAASHKYARSESESSSPQPLDSERRSAMSKKVKPRILQAKPAPKRVNKFDSTDYQQQQQHRPNEQSNTWNDAPNDRYQQRDRQQPHSDELPATKSARSAEPLNHRQKQPLPKTRPNDRQPINNRSKATPSLLQQNPSIEHPPSTSNRSQEAWRLQSPNQPMEELTSQEPVNYKSQPRANLNDHKQGYAMINTASIPPLMSVRSDPASTAKLYQSSSTHYPQHNEYYNDGNEDETGYYESDLTSHQRYQSSTMHNRGYTALGPYGRYRRSGAHRHQQHYAGYHTHPTVPSAPSTVSGPRQKKTASANRTTSSNSKKVHDSSDLTKTPVLDEEISSLMTKQLNMDDVSVPRPIETSIPSPLIDVKKPSVSLDRKSPPKNDNEPNAVPDDRTDNEPAKVNKKTPTVAHAKRRGNKDQQSYYPNQPPPRHRNNYPRATQDYGEMPMASTQDYYGATRRTATSGRNRPIQDLSTGYYYEHPQQHYNTRYNYSNEHYQQQQQPSARFNPKKSSKRGGVSTVATRPQKSQVSNGNNSSNHRHHSVSDNDQKEGEEWETASESSTNMRTGHYDNNGGGHPPANDIGSNHRGRTPPKKSFSSQRPNARQIFKYTNA